MKIFGEVKKNLGRGKTLGFPTANLDVDAKDLETGVYAAWTWMDSQKFPSIVFIGAAETFRDTKKFVESYILDFSGDLYGASLTLELLQKLRDNHKFSDAAALIAQMKQDEKVAREFFKSYNRKN